MWRSDRRSQALCCSTTTPPTLDERSPASRKQLLAPEEGLYRCGTRQFSRRDLTLLGEVLLNDLPLSCCSDQISLAVLSSDARDLQTDDRLLIESLLTPLFCLLSELVVLEHLEVHRHESVEDGVDSLPIVRVHSFERRERVGERLRDALEKQERADQRDAHDDDQYAQKRPDHVRDSTARARRIAVRSRWARMSISASLSWTRRSSRLICLRSCFSVSGLIQPAVTAMSATQSMHR